MVEYTASLFQFAGINGFTFKGVQDQLGADPSKNRSLRGPEKGFLDGFAGQGSALMHEALAVLVTFDRFLLRHDLKKFGRVGVSRASAISCVMECFGGPCCGAGTNIRARPEGVWADSDPVECRGRRTLPTST